MFSQTSCIKLLENNKSEYKIIIPEKYSDNELKAASKFQYYFSKVSLYDLDILMDSEKESKFEIVIGKTNRKESNSEIDYNKFGEDGFLIKTDSNKLILTGGWDKGSLYAVVTFFEKYLDCRMYSSTALVFPKKENINLSLIYDSQLPAFSYRELHFPDPIMNDDYCDWHKLDKKTGKDEWGMFVHTFKELIPPEIYFKDHPEYFSFLNIQRIPDGQLCLSNNDVLLIAVSRLEQMMKKKPNARYWSVSQNDTYKACECDECKKLYKKYGGYSGAMIWFVNKIAEKFPDKIISTLAYQYTRKAPKDIKPADNVNIMFCSIECNRSRPLENDVESIDFVNDATNWCSLTSNIFMWDYVVQFRNLVSPFPNLFVLQANLLYFKKLGMQMMFQQGSGNSKSEFYELREYIISKLLWNPNEDINLIINDFVNGFYGPAGKYIYEYISLIHKSLSDSNGDIGIYGFPYDQINTSLKPELIKKYNIIFDKAEESVKIPEYNIYLQRVKEARLPLEFAMLDISLRNINSDLSYFSYEGNQRITNIEKINLLETMTSEAKKYGYTKFWEHGNPPDLYCKSIKEYVQNSLKENKAFNCKVELLSDASNKYQVGGAKALTDGLRGVSDYHFNWLGFEGSDMIAVVDLIENKTISNVSCSFLQDIASWIFLPLEMEIFISDDNKNFKSIGKYINTTSAKNEGSFMMDFSINIQSISCRYIKVAAKNMQVCPSWHAGYNLPSWIFCDEIVIN